MVYLWGGYGNGAVGMTLCDGVSLGVMVMAPWV